MTLEVIIMLGIFWANYGLQPEPIGMIGKYYALGYFINSQTTVSY